MTKEKISVGPVKRVLTIAGSDSGGGAGIQADLKTIAALGGYGMSVITALTSQNTLGIQDIYEIPSAFVEKQFDSVASDIGIDAAKTGMLFGTATIESVARKIRQYHVERLVVDPVASAKDGHPLVKDEALEVLVRNLFPLALVVTPNIAEARLISRRKIDSPEDMKEAARVIHALGPKNVVVKGGHLAGDPIDILFDGRAFYEFPSVRLPARDTHGTGCTFASAVATGLAGDLSVAEAVGSAQRYVAAAIRFSLRLGKGRGPLDHMAPFFAMQRCNDREGL